MAEEDIKGEQGPIEPAGVLTTKRRRWLALKIAGGLMAAILLLVLAAPTLVGTRPVLSIILGQVNDKLNGHVEVSSLSLGWFSGTKIEGVRVFDSSKSQIAEVDRLVIPLPLWKALAGKLALGDVVCDGLSLDARYDAQHRLNFAQLLKHGPAPAGAAPPANLTATPSAPAEPKASKLPAISGTIKLTNCRATVSQPGKPTVYFSNVNGELKIPDINQPIEDSLNLAIRTGNGQEGSLAVTGSAAVIRQNSIALDSAEIHQQIDLTNLDLQTARPFIPDSTGVDVLDGVLGIHISADVTGGKDAAVDASVTGKNKISIGGRVLRGDTFSTAIFEAAIPKLTAVFPDGLANWQLGRIKVGADAGTSPILFKVDQGQVTVVADVAPQAILNLTDRKSPEFAGKLVVDSSFDIAQLIPKLRNTLGMPSSILVQSGAFSEKLALSMTPAAANLSETIDSTPVIGIRAEPGGEPTSISIDPIHLSLSSDDHGGGGAIPDLRSIKLTLSSKFIHGDFQGNTLADLNGTLTADLTAAMNEFKQFAPGSKLLLGGNVNLKIGQTGDLKQSPYQSALAMNLSADHLQYSGGAGSPIDEPLVRFDLLANLQGSAAGAVTSIDKLLLTLKTSRITAPITVAVTNAELSSTTTSMLDQLHAAHLQVDVPDLKSVMQEVGALSAPSAPASPVASGSISITGDLSHDSAGLTINLANISGRGLAFQHGSTVYPAAPIDLKMLVGIQTGAGKSIVEQLTHVGIKLTGNLSELSQFLAAYGGEKPDAYPYSGDFAIQENVALHRNAIVLSGGLEVAHFQCRNGDAISFSEDLLALTDDVSLISVPNDKSVAINALSLSMQSSGALHVAISNGAIHHLQTSRDMRLQPMIDYDLTKLWPIVQPMMGDKYKTLKITGQFKKQFNVTGSYPADEPSTVAIKTLHADGDLAIATFDYDGLNMQDFVVPFTLDDGKLVTVYANKPAGQNTAAPAVANGGLLDLGDLTLDLTQDPPRLFVPANKLLISRLTINPLFSNSYLAKYLNNPVFTGNNNASGLLDLTMVDCDALPLGDLVTTALPANTGKADIRFSLTDLHIGLAGVSGLASVLKEDSFAASVKDGTVAVAKGRSTEHISFVSGQYSLSFDGTVRLADEALIPLNLSVGPVSVFAQRVLGTHNQRTLSGLPKTLNIPVRGTVSHASIDAGAVAKEIAGIVLKLEGSRFLGGDKSGDNPLGGLLKGLEKK